MLKYELVSYNEISLLIFQLSRQYLFFSFLHVSVLVFFSKKGVSILEFWVQLLVIQMSASSISRKHRQYEFVY